MATRIVTQEGFFYLSEKMSPAMEDLVRRSWRFSASPRWQPAVNICETPDTYCVCVDLAGMRRDKIDVRVEPGRLTIQGQRPIPRPKAKCDQLRMRQMEINHGPFCRELDLPPDVDTDNIAATYRNGMLWIELPKHRK